MSGHALRSGLPKLAVSVLLVWVTACSNRGDGAEAGAPDTSEAIASTQPSASTEPALSTQPATSDATVSTSFGDRADGVLTIGTLLPQTGPGNEIGIAAIDAVNVGIAGINARGGVLQQPVRWENADEGESIDDARAGINKLLERNVDAVIGPASSLVAIDVLDDLMDAGVVVCSPTANAMVLNDYPGRERFFRTVPSDSLTAQAMAEVALGTGVDSYAVVYLDDQYGRPFAQQTIGRLTRGEVAELYERPFASDATPEEFAAIAAELVERAPRTIMVIADSRRGWAMLQALAEEFDTEPPFIIVNDPMRNPPNTDVVAGLPPAFRGQIQGVSPLVPPERSEPTGAYATNALDCLNLIALATVVAGTDDPEAIAAEMANVSVGGTGCGSFAQCLMIVEQDRTINYQGPNALDLSTRGDPTRGRIGIFQFDPTGLDFPSGWTAITEQESE